MIGYPQERRGREDHPNRWGWVPARSIQSSISRLSHSRYPRRPRAGNPGALAPRRRQHVRRRPEPRQQPHELRRTHPRHQHQRQPLPMYCIQRHAKTIVCPREFRDYQAMPHSAGHRHEMPGYQESCVIWLPSHDTTPTGKGALGMDSPEFPLDSVGWRRLEIQWAHNPNVAVRILPPLVQVFGKDRPHGVPLTRYRCVSLRRSSVSPATTGEAENEPSSLLTANSR